MSLTQVDLYQDLSALALSPAGSLTINCKTGVDFDRMAFQVDARDGGARQVTTRRYIPLGDAAKRE